MCKHSRTFRGLAAAEIHCLPRCPHLEAKGHVTLKRLESVCDSLRGKRGGGVGGGAAAAKAFPGLAPNFMQRPFVVAGQTANCVACEADCDPR